MTHRLRQLALVAATVAIGATLSAPLHAQELDHDQLMRFFQMSEIDKNKDSMVSKKEFMDMMAKAWDAGMKSMAKDKKMGADKMTREQYLEFSKMLGLNFGA